MENLTMYATKKKTTAILFSNQPRNLEKHRNLIRLMIAEKKANHERRKASVIFYPREIIYKEYQK